MIIIIGAAAAVLLAPTPAQKTSTPSSSFRRGQPRTPLSLTVCAVLVCPLIWSLSTLNPAYAGTANDAHAGPYFASANARQRMSATLNDGNYGIGLASNQAVTETAAAETAMYQYAIAHSGNTPYAIATDSWRSAAPLILHGGQRVLPIGGYSSRVPSPTVTEIKNLVANGS
ncbi:MAG: hypothetical protein M3021_04415 [Actinomycetota bacterium]|nr:hypothetical protein [Actinomycetota bacterium]